MISRVEIDGFKSFIGFTVDVPPFMVIAGGNGSGKSNLIDALRLIPGPSFDSNDGLLRLGDRGVADQLFHQRADGSRVRELSIAVDLVVDAQDGPIVMRCKLASGRDEPLDWYDSLSVTGFDSVLRRGAPQGGGVPRDASRGFQTLAVAAHQRAYGESTDAEVDLTREGVGARDLLSAPAPLGLDGECAAWHFLDADPRRMRGRAPVRDRGPLSGDGANLAAVLGRLGETTALQDLVLDAGSVIPGLLDIRPVVDHRGDYWDFDLAFAETGVVPPALASDGTLRTLALLAALHDPKHGGVLVVDEVENGLHPSRLGVLIDIMRERVTDWRHDDGWRSPARQVVLTTHSPVVVSMTLSENASDVVFLDTVYHVSEARDRDRVGSMITRARQVADGGAPGTYVTPTEVRQYLDNVRRVAR